MKNLRIVSLGLCSIHFCKAKQAIGVLKRHLVTLGVKKQLQSWLLGHRNNVVLIHMLDLRGTQRSYVNVPIAKVTLFLPLFVWKDQYLIKKPFNMEYFEWAYNN